VALRGVATRFDWIDGFTLGAGAIRSLIMASAGGLHCARPALSLIPILLRRTRDYEILYLFIFVILLRHALSGFAFTFPHRLAESRKYRAALTSMAIKFRGLLCETAFVSRSVALP